MIFGVGVRGGGDFSKMLSSQTLQSGQATAQTFETNSQQEKPQKTVLKLITSQVAALGMICERS